MHAGMMLNYDIYKVRKEDGGGNKQRPTLREKQNLQTINIQNVKKLFMDYLSKC